MRDTLLGGCIGTFIFLFLLHFTVTVPVPSDDKKPSLDPPSMSGVWECYADYDDEEDEENNGTTTKYLAYPYVDVSKDDKGDLRAVWFNKADRVEYIGTFSKAYTINEDGAYTTEEYQKSDALSWTSPWTWRWDGKEEQWEGKGYYLKRPKKVGDNKIDMRDLR